MENFNTESRLCRFKMKVGFIFPNGTVSRFTAAKLLETGYEVAFYCPETADLDIAKGLIFELNIIAKEVNQTRNIDQSFYVLTNNDMRDCDIIGKGSFPNYKVEKVWIWSKVEIPRPNRGVEIFLRRNNPLK